MDVPIMMSLSVNELVAIRESLIASIERLGVDDRQGVTLRLLGKVVLELEKSE